MASSSEDARLLAWHQQLRALALAQDQGWLVSCNPHDHAPAFQRGVTPEDEFAELARVGEWRGYGCGAG